MSRYPQGARETVKRPGDIVFGAGGLVLIVLRDGSFAPWESPSRRDQKRPAGQPQNLRHSAAKKKEK